MPILNGIRVLDFTQYLAGLVVTRLIAEVGTEIIKIEHAPSGDPSGGLPFLKDGRSGYFVQRNRGKQSVCLAFPKPEAREVLYDLVKKVDVMVENYGPGAMARRGLDYTSAAKLNPKLFMASISSFGNAIAFGQRIAQRTLRRRGVRLSRCSNPCRK